MSISVLGIGTVSALGCGIDTVREGLEGKANISFTDGEALLKVYKASINGLDRYVARPALRRIDRFNQMALLSSFLAIDDSGIIPEDRERIGIVFGSGYGPLQTTFSFLDSLIDFGDRCASPTLFANSVHNSLASQASILLKIQGPCLTISCFEQTTCSVMSTAISWLREGIVDYVLAGVGDESCDVRSYATLLLGGGGCSEINPLSFDECSYLYGEGFVVFLLGVGTTDRGYCNLISAETGENEVSGDHEILFLAANGDKETGRFYRPLINNRGRVRAYSPLYGGMPVGNGFDIAIAALSLKEGVVYPLPLLAPLLAPLQAPVPGEISSGITVVPEQIDNNTGNARISCVGFDGNGNYSLITLAK